MPAFVNTLVPDISYNRVPKSELYLAIVKHKPTAVPCYSEAFPVSTVGPTALILHSPHPISVHNLVWVWVAFLTE